MKCCRTKFLQDSRDTLASPAGTCGIPDLPVEPVVEHRRLRAGYPAEASEPLQGCGRYDSDIRIPGGQVIEGVVFGINGYRQVQTRSIWEGPVGTKGKFLESTVHVRPRARSSQRDCG